MAASRKGAVGPLSGPGAMEYNARRRRMKLISITAWYRPADTVLKVPYTPGLELARM